MKKINYILLSLFLIVTGCSLDYENTDAINPDNVWKDKKMITAILTDISGGMMPGWSPTSANNTDEGMNEASDMSEFARGLVSTDNYNMGFGYDNIDKINYFLTELKNVPTTVLSEKENEELLGQALFWRAWDYWGKVREVGGVPLILQPQDITNLPSLFVKRNSTSECIERILIDLDEAIDNLPVQWDNDNYGRIDKGCAMAFKGRVLLWYASPLFNPDNKKERWEAAYTANKEAIDFLKNVGKGLYEGAFEDIWYDERNREVIMVNQFYYSDHTFNQTRIRPEPFCNGSANGNQAIMSLMLAFPKKDGSKLDLDIQRLASDLDYNAKFVNDFYTNRDPRFYATVFSPGTVYPSADKSNATQSYWNAWKVVYEGADLRYVTLVQNQLGVGVGGQTSGWFQLKGLDRSLDQGTLSYAETDWIEIRFTEALMNLGECANEIDKKEEALQVLYDVRKRAGIVSNDGRYGITANTQDDIRQAYVDERLIEFAYEDKRWGDLRRWKRFDILNTMKYRSGLHLVIKDNDDIQSMDWSHNMINDSEVRKLFRFDYIECLDSNTDYKFNLSSKHWFKAIKKEDLDKNSKLEQNNEWGGTFDPLK